MSHLYKVDSDKGFKILCAVSPAVIFVNGIRFSEINVFIDRFKTTDMDIFGIENIYSRLASRFNVTKGALYEYFADASQFGNHPEWDAALISELHTFLNRFRQTSCLIYGDIGAMGMITKIFNDDHSIFTYVYMYPNSTELYKQAITTWLSNIEENKEIGIVALDELIKGRSDKKHEKRLDAYVKQMLESRKTNFKVHTEALGKALVILGPK